MMTFTCHQVFKWDRVCLKLHVTFCLFIPLFTAKLGTYEILDCDLRSV